MKPPVRQTEDDGSRAALIVSICRRETAPLPPGQGEPVAWMYQRRPAGGVWSEEFSDDEPRLDTTDDIRGVLALYTAPPPPSVDGGNQGLEASQGTTPSPSADQAVVPEGWKLVPVEPTDDMKLAGEPECRREKPEHKLSPKRAAIDAYRAMLAASPTPPQGTTPVWSAPQNPSVDADLLTALNLISRNNPRYSILCPDGEYRTADDIARSAIARAESSQGQAAWQPIETAPEFEVIVVSDGTRATDAAKNPTDWGDHYWSADDMDGPLDFIPTVWMPLPSLAASQGVDASLVEDFGAGTGSPTSRRGSHITSRSSDA